MTNVMTKVCYGGINTKCFGFIGEERPKESRKSIALEAKLRMGLEERAELHQGRHRVLATRVQGILGTLGTCCTHEPCREPPVSAWDDYCCVSFSDFGANTLWI